MNQKITDYSATVPLPGAIDNPAKPSSEAHTNTLRMISVCEEAVCLLPDIRLTSHSILSHSGVVCFIPGFKFYGTFYGTISQIQRHPKRNAPV